MALTKGKGKGRDRKNNGEKGKLSRRNTSDINILTRIKKIGEQIACETGEIKKDLGKSKIERLFRNTHKTGEKGGRR